MEQQPERVGIPPEDDHPVFGASGGRRRARRKRNGLGCLAGLVVVALLVGGATLLVVAGASKVQDVFGGPSDYSGSGTGQVTVEVKEGDSSAAIGRTLKAAGVVKSVDAFVDAATADERARGIQVGFYELRKEMSAASALDLLVNSENLLRAQVTVPEGLTVDQIVDTLAKGTDFTAAQFDRVLRRPASIGLPAYAEGSAEGFLFPATYDIRPDATPRSVLTEMVNRWRVTAEEADLAGATSRLGYSERELMTIASLVEAEARGDDMAKVARVIYNRLQDDGPPTFGKLEIDATVNYALGRNLGVALSAEDLQVDSPYNTRRYAGLPPGPIEAPGAAAIEAAIRPAEGDWYFYVTVDLRTGETKFAETYEEFLQYKAELQVYCETSDAC